MVKDERVEVVSFTTDPKLKEVDYLMSVSPSGGCVPQNGAEEGTRTPTAFPPLEPESSASANSATSAITYNIFIKKNLSIRDAEIKLDYFFSIC